MRAANVTWKGIRLDDVKEMDFSPAEFEVFALKRGDVLVGEASGSRLEVGKSAVWRGEIAGACFQNTLIRVRAGDAILPEYLQKHLTHDALRGALADISKGIGIHHLGAAGLAEWRIAVPPLPEQKRIADKLDALLARVDACRDRLDRVPAILKRFRQAVLDAATNGDLSADWRTEHEQPAWATSTLGACGVVAGGLTKNGKREGLALARPYLRVANVYANRLELDDVAQIGLTEAEHQKTRLASGDLLIVEGNGSLDQLGRVALWNGELPDCVHQNHLIRWRSSGPRPRYVLYWLLSPRGRESITDLASTTTGLHTLSISKVAAVPIELPTDDEQAEIVRRVDALFALADTLEARVATARAQVERLTPALLSKAFRGELVPQDPNDEPASALLARLRMASTPPAASGLSNKRAPKPKAVRPSVRR
jgi:type I restriction enzyme S subunit